MSSTNYDVVFNLTYNNAYRHYIPRYKVAVPYYWMSSYGSAADFKVNISFDEGSESSIYYAWVEDFSPPLTQFFYNTDSGSSVKHDLIPDAGYFEKVYLRNPYPDKVTFTSGNCRVGITYAAKVPFEVKFNSTGFAANQNAWFKCSTVQKNAVAQYEWESATVYYRKSGTSTYQSVAGTVSGTWSDVRIDTNVGFEDGYTYDVYIRAVGDDNSVANTPVGQFTTTDASAVANCIAPVGAFTQGEVTFVWSHTTEYGTPQYAYDLQYSNNNGSSWTTVAEHVVTQTTNTSTTINDAGTYKWRVRTYNSNDVVGEWAEASFVNNVPANPPTNLSVNTKGRPTVSWASMSQSAYQVQFLQGDSVVYDSGAVYTSETSHFVNQYFNDERFYTVRLRVYNALGEVTDWIETGYQQPSVDNVEFTVVAQEDGGAVITVTPDDVFTNYYLLRNNKLVSEITGGSYIDPFAIGQTNYSVVGVTSEDQSDIQTIGVRITYPYATIIAQNGQQFAINKRVDSAYEIQTDNEADVNKVNFIGDNFPTHYPSDLTLKSFTATLFDDWGIAENILGTLVFYADNFGNGGWCIVKAYDKTDSYIKNSQGIYANEVALTLEVTNYDDSIEYPL
ncbi:MAG: hypothetical protein IIY21_16155 [Clostridiales bacterium]|nr:hypothetical protein [Clostridiales bacterium]MBQ1570096.1 hypothetical protein [Clostridiales bacterium]